MSVKAYDSQSQGTLTLQERGSPPEEIEHHSLTLPESEKVPDIQAAFITLIVFGEDVFEILRLEPSFVVVCHGVAAMFVFVDSVDVDAEERVRQEAGECRV